VITFCLRCYGIVLLTLSSLVSLAQPGDRKIVNQSIEWVSVTTNWKISKRTSLIAEGQFRQAEAFQPMQYQFRTGAEITLNKHFSIVPVGYVYTWNHKYGEQPATFENNEHRVWEQVTYKHTFSRLKLSHRMRLEQRFIQSHVDNGDGHIVNEGYSIFQNRLRYRFAAVLPLNHAALDPKTWFASVYNEAFLSWGEKVTFHEPDQNRLYGGVGYQLSKPLSVQAGMLYQMLIKANGAKQENNVGVQVQVVYNIDLTH
jgi:hypothetical protein